MHSTKVGKRGSSLFTLILRIMIAQRLEIISDVERLMTGVDELRTVVTI